MTIHELMRQLSHIARETQPLASPPPPSRQFDFYSLRWCKYIKNKEYIPLSHWIKQNYTINVQMLIGILKRGLITIALNAQNAFHT